MTFSWLSPMVEMEHGYLLLRKVAMEQAQYKVDGGFEFQVFCFFKCR